MCTLPSRRRPRSTRPAPGRRKKRSRRIKRSPRLYADLALLLIALIWGSAFAVMRVAAGHGTIFLLNGSRFLLGGLLLAPFVRWKGAFPRGGWIYIFLAGLALFAGVAFQQAGLTHTTAGNAGFITSLAVVVVPIILLLGWRERPSPWIVAAVLLAALGAFLLSTGGRLTVHTGDGLILAGTFFWAMHVVVVGKGQKAIQPLPFAFGQYMVCGVLNMLVGGLFERPTGADMLYVLPAVLYTGVLSIALGFTLQVWAQSHTPPADAALIMSTEGVFAAVFGWIFLGENLGFLQVLGCALILAAVLLAQLRPGMVQYRKIKAGSP